MLIAGKKREADKIFRQSYEEFTNLMDEAKLRSRKDDEGELIRKIEDFYRQYVNLYHWLEKYYEKQDSSKVDFYSKAIRMQQDNLRQQILSLLEMNRQEMDKVSRQYEKLSEQNISYMIIFSFIGVALGVGLSIWLTNIIVGPVEELTRAVTEIRKGNLDISISVPPSGEIGILAAEFNKMTERLKEYQKVNLEKLLEEKKRAEAILRSVGDCLIVVDPSYKIIMVNPSAERVFYLLPGISIGQDFRNIIKNQELFELIKSGIERLDRAGGPSLPTFEWEFDRVTKHFQVKVFPVEKEDGAQLAYVILLEDVTKLKELDQLKSDFVSIASHELRTPLTSIIMSLGMVSDGTAGPLNDDQKELLAAAYEDAERMRHLMTSLLDISRIETGRVDMDMAPVSPGGIVEEISNSFKIQAQEKGVELFTRVPEGLPSVQADRSRILQVLTNLITNALRYTPAGGSITVSASSREGYVVFTVADTGRGIPRDYLKKIFRKFVQVANDPNPGGAGLGLALCHEIVKAHNGNIWVESEMDRGSRFMFTLPISTPF
jgi:NtrC-family two-component system sensor histidine kinase KinB